MTNKTPITSLVSALDAIPNDYISQMKVGDLRALLRLSIASETSSGLYRPLVDAPRLCNMSKGRFRFVKLHADEGRNLETFTLTEEGKQIITNISNAI